MASMGGHNTGAREMAGMSLVKPVLGGGPGTNNEELGRRPGDAGCGRMFLVSNPGHRSEIQGELFGHRDRTQKY